MKTSKETQCIAANAKISLVITLMKDDSLCSNSVEEIQNIKQRKNKEETMTKWIKFSCNAFCHHQNEVAMA